jgi:CelD/BcsL family acetyltransferase involved in cellulose biosynthesis
MRPMGTGVGADHLGFVMRRGAEADAGRALAAAMVSSDGWDVLDLPRLDGATAQFLLQAASAVPAGRLAWTSRVADQCPYISLPQTWEAYLGALSSNARKDLGRRWRRLRERGRVTIERLTEPPDLERGWDALLRLHRDRRERAGGRSAFTTGRVGAFHEAFLRAAAERGWVRLYLMRVDGHEVAAEYCLKVGPRVSDLQTGSDGGWAHYGVGTLIVAHAIQEAIAEGAREYDLLRGGESYKQQRWGASIREDVSLLVWRRRPRARLFMAARAWEAAAKSYLRRRLRGRRGRG